MPTLLQELTEYYICHIGWRRTKQSGWWEINSTFAMDIFNFFQHFRWKFLTGSKFSDYVPFTQDVNPLRFEVFRLYSLYTGWKFSTGSKFSDYIPFTQDGNPRRFEVFRLYFHCKGWKSPTLFKGWKYPTVRSFLLIFPIKGRKSLNFTAKKITSNKSFVQFHYAHTEL
jgi:hypothetical protein